jgi:hypothetical protein
MASNLAGFCARRIEEFGYHVYGDHLSESDSERRVWRSRTHDIAAGFAGLGSVTGNSHWTDVAAKEVSAALDTRSIGAESILAAGAIPTNPTSESGEQEVPAFGGFYSVWILLAAALNEAGPSKWQSASQSKALNT